MATKHGQEAIDTWAKMRAQHRTKLRVIGVAVVLGILFMVAKHYTGT